MEERNVGGVLMQHVFFAVKDLRYYVMLVDSSHVALQLSPEDIAILNQDVEDISVERTRNYLHYIFGLQRRVDMSQIYLVDVGLVLKLLQVQLDAQIRSQG